MGIGPGFNAIAFRASKDRVLKYQTLYFLVTRKSGASALLPSGTGKASVTLREAF